MVLTAARHWTLSDGTLHPTGFWAEEFVVPDNAFINTGWDVTIATPGAVSPVVDELSLGLSGGLPRTTSKLHSRLDELAAVLASPIDLHQVDADTYERGLLPLRTFVVVDEDLYTGQNPQSSKKLAAALIDALS